MRDSDRRQEAETYEGFDAVYESNVDVVYSYAVVRLGRSDAEDVTSEVFHAAALAFRTGRAEQVSTAWLVAVTRNKVIDRWRRAERRMLKSHLVGQDETVFPDDWTHDERRERVLAALERLKVRHRRLLVMHHVDGIGLEDIAAELGETRQAVESAVARARSAFRKHYDRVGREVDR